VPEYIELSSLFLLDFNRVTIRVPDHECFAEFELSILIRNHARRNKLISETDPAGSSRGKADEFQVRRSGRTKTARARSEVSVSVR
jgi:hypothetical protein